MDYALYIVAIASICAVIAIATDLTTGLTGMVSLAQASIFGVGAYATALCLTSGGVLYSLALPFAAFSGMVVSFVIGMLAVKARGDRAVVGTIAIQMMVLSIITNWESFTGGPFGIRGIDPLRIWRLRFDTPFKFAVASVLASLGTLWLAQRVARSPFGRVLRAVRDDEKFALSIGKDPAHVKLIVALTSGGVIGLAGGLFATTAGFIDPTSFTLSESILVLSMVIFGGLGSTWGPAIGACVLIAVPEVLRFVGMPAPMIGNIRQILYGLVLIVILMFRPRGLWGKYSLEQGR